MAISTKYNNRAYDLFISWNHRDEELVTKIKAHQEDFNIDPYCSLAGDTSGRLSEILLEIDNCIAFAIVLTKNSMASYYCLSEYLKAYTTLGVKKIMPLCFDKPYLLKNKDIITITEDDVTRDFTNCFNPKLYEENPNEKADVQGLELLNKEVHQALLDLWNEIGSLYANSEEPNHEFIKNSLNRVVSEGIIEAIINKKEDFNAKQLYTSEKVNSSDLYLDRYLKDIDGNEYDEGQTIDLILSGDILITASAGIGKTELIKSFKNKINLEKEKHVAIFLELKKYLKDNDSLFLNFLYKELYGEYPVQITPANLKGLLSSNNCVIFLDGFDELIYESTRATLIKELEIFKSSYPKSSIVITSRYEFRELKNSHLNFAHLELLGFKDEDILKYVNNLFYSVEIENSNNEKETFYFELGKIDKEIRENPLFLSQIIFIYKKEKLIPKTKYEILEKTSKYIVDVDNPRLLFESPEEQTVFLNIIRESVLPYLAYQMHYESDSDPVASYLIKNGLKKTDMMYSIQKSRIETFLSSRSIYVEGEIAGLAPVLIDFYATEYVFNEFFDDKLNVNQHEFECFLNKHHDKIELISMLITRFDFFYHKNESLSDEYKNCLSLLVQNNVNAETILDLTSVLYSNEFTKEITFKYFLRKVILNRENYYHELFFYIHHYELLDYFKNSLENLLLDESLDKGLVLSIYRDYFVLLKDTRKVGDNISKNTRDIITKYLENNPSYRSTLNSVFYEIDVTYLNSFITEDSKRIHPFFFNLYLMMKDDPREILGDTKLDINFVDEYGIYQNNINNSEELMGVISLDYDSSRVESLFSNLKSLKTIGLIFNSTDETEFVPFKINKKNISLLVLPSEIKKIALAAFKLYSTNESALYIEYGIDKCGEVDHAYFTSFYMPNSVNELISSGLDEISPKHLYLSNNIRQIKRFQLFKMEMLEDVLLPNKLEVLEESTLVSNKLKEIELPNGLVKLKTTFGGSDISYIFIPKTVKECPYIGESEDVSTFIFETDVNEVSNNIGKDGFRDFKGISIFFNVKKEYVLKDKEYIYIKTNDNNLILIGFRNHKNIEEQITIHDELKIDNVSYHIEMINVAAFYKEKIQLLRLVGNIFPIKEDFENIVYFSSYYKDYRLYVIGDFKEEDIKSFRHNAPPLTIFVSANKDEIFTVFDEALYRIKDNEASLVHLVSYAKYAIPSVITTKDKKSYPVTKIEKDALLVDIFGEFESNRPVSFEHERNTSNAIFIPSSINVIEPQEYLANSHKKNIKPFIHVGHDEIPEGFDELLRPLFIIDSKLFNEKSEIVYGLKEDHAVLEMVDDSLEDDTILEIPNHVLINGNYYPVEEISERAGHYLMMFNKVILPDTLKIADTIFDFSNTLERNSVDNGSCYYGSHNNPYLVYSYGYLKKETVFKAKNISRETKILCFYQLETFKRVEIPNYICSVSIVGHSEEMAENLIFMGTIEEFLKVHFSRNALGHFRHIFVLDDNENEVELTDLVIPGEEKIIHTGKYIGISSFNSVTLENGIEAIEKDAFSDLNTQKLFLPASLKVVEESFRFTSNYPTDVYYDGTIFSFLKVHFKEGISYLPNVNLYVKDELTNEYTLVTSITFNGEVDELPLKQIDGLYSLKTIIIKSGIKKLSLYNLEDTKVEEIYVFDPDCKILPSSLSYDYRHTKIYSVQESTDRFNEVNHGVYLGVNFDNFIELDGVRYLVLDDCAYVTDLYLNQEEYIIRDEVELNGKTYLVKFIGGHIAFRSKLKRIVLSNNLEFHTVSLYKKDYVLEDRYLASNQNEYFELTSIEGNDLVFFVNENTKIVNMEFVQCTYSPVIFIPKGVIAVTMTWHAPDIAIYEGYRDDLKHFSLDDDRRVVYEGIKKENIYIDNNLVYILKDNFEATLIYANQQLESVITVPDILIINNKTYRVTEIGQDAFKNYEGNIFYLNLPKGIKINNKLGLAYRIRKFVATDYDGVLENEERNIVLNGRILTYENLIILINEELKVLDILMVNDSSKVVEILDQYEINNEVYKTRHIYSSVILSNVDELYIPFNITKLSFIGIRDKSCRPLKLYLKMTLDDFLRAKTEWYGNVNSQRMELYLFNPENHNYYLSSTITEITIPEDIMIITSDLFLLAADSLKKITLPKKIKFIGTKAFKDLHNLEEIVFQEETEINYIRDYIFPNNKYIKTITLPKNVKVVDPNIFNESSVENAYVPVHLTGIINAKTEEVKDDMLYLTFDVIIDDEEE